MVVHWVDGLLVEVRAGHHLQAVEVQAGLAGRDVRAGEAEESMVTKQGK